MTITFFINYLNHHQLPIADEMYKLLGNNFHFVATFVRDKSELKGGIDYSDRPYCLLPAERSNDLQLAHELNLKSDVCVFGAGNLQWEKERAQNCPNKLSFEISERWLKKGYINLLSPHLIKWWWIYQTTLRNKPFYKLCASAYTAIDCFKLLTFKNRCYKWGYFTAVPHLGEEDRNSKISSGMVSLMWCARFINWKHPEIPIKLAKILKDEGYKFVINMYGDGPKRKEMQQLVDFLGVKDVVFLKGNRANMEILQAMRQSDLFLFTSNKEEGWGVVVNEAMSCQCCVVGSREAGAVPYLIEDGYNGYTYECLNLGSLHKKVKYLLDNPNERLRFAQNAYQDMVGIWNPVTAARNLLQLIDDLISCRETSITNGPCSKA